MANIRRGPRYRYQPLPERARVAAQRSARLAPVFAVVLVLAAAGLPRAAAVVAGGPTLSVTPGTASRGATVTVDGTGFGSHQHGDLSIDGSQAGLPDFRTDATGAFSVSIAVPSSLSDGGHTLVARTSNGHYLQSASLTVGTVTSAATQAPTAVPSPTSPATPAPTATPSPTSTPSPTPAATPSPTSTASPTPSPTPTASPTGATGSAGVPAFSHIYLIVMENQEYGSIIGNGAAPYLNTLAAKYGLATNYDAVTHPSEPNYFALWSGSTQGVTDDGTYDLSGTNLVDQLAAKGRSWKVFAQNVPTGCFTGTSSSGGEDGPGTYVRRHEPAISFTDISRNAGRCANITDVSHFDPAGAQLELVVPNTCNDMHDCSVATGDAWLSSFVPRIISSSSFANSALFITWDEGTTSTGGGGHVATLVISPLTKAGIRSATYHDHYSLLRTIEDAWGLGCLGHTCSAGNMAEFFAP